MNWVPILGSGIVGLITGIVLANYHAFRFQDKMDVANLLNVGVTLFIAVTLTQFYARQHSTKQVEKGLLLDHANDIHDSINETYKVFGEYQAGKKITRQFADKITDSERKLSNAVHSFEVAMRCCKIDGTRVGFWAVRDSRFDLKESLTDSPFPVGPFDSARVSTILADFKALREHLTELRFKINTTVA